MMKMTLRATVALSLSIALAAGGGAGRTSVAPVTEVVAAPAPSPAPPARGSLVQMGTTDIHGWLLPYDYYTGKTTNNSLASLVPLIDSVRAANPGRSLLVESGDLLQGNPLDFVYSHLAPGEVHPLVRAMNLVGYDA